MNAQYNRLYDEILFTRQLLGIGLTYLRKSSFENKGVYFQSFTNLSLGIERLCKICLIVNHLKSHNSYPNTKDVTKFGHNLVKLFESISTLKEASNELKEIHKSIISHLSNFADSKGRYSNINFLTEGSTFDPILEWSNIDNIIINNLLTEKQKEKLEAQKHSHYLLGNSLPAFTSGFEDERRESISNVGTLFSRNIEINYISGYRCLYVIQIIEFLFNVLNSLNHKLNSKFHLKELNRVFATILYGTDAEKRRRKNFVRDS